MTTEDVLSICTHVCRFFVVASSVVCAYLVLSLPASVVHVVRPGARSSRAILAFLDTVASDGCSFYYWLARALRACLY